jgi:hypothetical protein
MSRPVSRIALGLAVAVGLLSACFIAGCGSGGPPRSTQPAVPATAPVSRAVTAATTAASAPAAGTPPVGTSPAATPPPTRPAVEHPPDPTPVATGAAIEPPAALLSGVGGAGEAPAGTLGTYTWGTRGTDAPWIVPSAGSGVAPGAPLAVAFEPSLIPQAWTARWAPVVNGVAGDVANATDGTGLPTLATPDRAGTWSLQLEARFGAARSATWYWRIELR